MFKFWELWNSNCLLNGTTAVSVLHALSDSEDFMKSWTGIWQEKTIFSRSKEICGAKLLIELIGIIGISLLHFLPTAQLLVQRKCVKATWGYAHLWRDVKTRRRNGSFSSWRSPRVVIFIERGGLGKLGMRYGITQLSTSNGNYPLRPTTVMGHIRAQRIFSTFLKIYLNCIFIICAK